MKRSDRRDNLRIELDTSHCDLSGAEIETMERDLATLVRCIRDFPVADLFVAVIHHLRSHDYHVKTALVLPGKTLFTGDRDALVHPAYDRCLRKLVRKVQAYKSRMSGDPQIARAEEGTDFRIEPTGLPDPEAIVGAARDGDYEAFRRACDVYSEPVRKSVGRWIQRHPQLDAEVGEHIAIADVVEEVFLNAFEQLGQKPSNVPMGTWLEQRIDPSLADLVLQPDAELANVSFVRTWLEAASPRAARNGGLHSPQRHRDAEKS